MAKQDEADIRLKVGFLRHPKTIRLRAALGAEGVVAFIALMAYVRVNHHRTGACGKLEDRDIEVLAEWAGEEGLFVRTLIELRLLDGKPGSRRVHEWTQHQPYAAMRHKRVAKARKAASARWSKTCDDAKSVLGASDEHASSNPPPPPLPRRRRRNAREAGPGGPPAPREPDRTPPPPTPERYPPVLAPPFVPPPRRLPPPQKSA